MGKTWRRIAIVSAVLVVAGMFAGIGWIAWWVNDNIGAPGPGPTGKGACTSADAVNLELVFTDGHAVQACTHDRPACPNQTVTETENGQTSSVSRFGLGNQLRSSSRRYILFVRFNAPLATEAGEQTLLIDPAAFLPGPPGSGPSSGGALTSAVVQITPRDPYEDAYTPGAGSVTVSSSHGVARGTIDGSFTVGQDRPPPTSMAASPLRVRGTFACNQ